jgi:hypothetical protein
MKAAAKLHLRLNLQSFLPGFAIIEEASHHDETVLVILSILMLSSLSLNAYKSTPFEKGYFYNL